MVCKSKQLQSDIVIGGMNHQAYADCGLRLAAIVWSEQ